MIFWGRNVENHSDVGQPRLRIEIDAKRGPMKLLAVNNRWIKIYQDLNRVLWCRVGIVVLDLYDRQSEPVSPWYSRPVTNCVWNLQPARTFAARTSARNSGKSLRRVCRRPSGVRS